MFKNVLSFSVLGSLSLAASAQLALANWDINPNELPEIRRLAHLIQMDSSEATQEALRYGAGSTWQEQNAVNSLRALAQSSIDLDRDVEGSWIDPVRSENDFYRVDQNFTQAQQGFSYLRAYAYNRAIFDRLSGSVSELRMLRSGEYSPAPGYPGADINRIRPIAHALTDSSEDLLRRARSEATFNQPWKQNAIREIEVLTNEASRLYTLTQTYWDPNQSRGELNEVLTAYSRTQQSVTHAQFSVFVNQSLERVSRNIADLSRAYSGGVAGPVLPMYPPVVTVPGGGPHGPSVPPYATGPRPVLVPGGGPVRPF